MANKTKQQLIVENNTLFPTNNAGAITADNLRAFNTDIINSTVNQDEYTTDSASFDARIEQSVVTASLVGDTLTFERENVLGLDISLVENQDRITDLVWITRASSQGIFNIKTENSYKMQIKIFTI